MELTDEEYFIQEMIAEGEDTITAEKESTQ
jgi:hypothetical protein